MEIATFGGGCFWCTEAVFQRVAGVKRVTPGYCGGTVENPSYEQVCSGSTGHAEVIQIEFESNEVTFEELLGIFFQTHDPTTLNRQGADVGTQYRSVVFYHSDSQKVQAETMIESFNRDQAFPQPVVTEVAPVAVFYPAEKYHWDYYNQNPQNGYCQVVVRSKVEKLKKILGKDSG